MQDEHGVDFLKKKYQLTPTRESKKKRKNLKRALWGFFIIAAAGSLLFSFQIAKTHVSDSSTPLSLVSTFRNLVRSGDKELTGETSDRINFLLLGVGGTGHDGPELSDTIIFASFKPSTNEIGFLSIPRDLIVSIPGYGYRKINHVNAYGEIEEPGSGPEAARQVIGELLNQEIHYYVKVDFDGFEELIDAVGGVDVYVDNSFSDYQYPTDDYKVQTISFEEGWDHFDGERALQYSRSRHGTNGEGSDFARAERQQNVILAAKKQILSPATLLNPGKLNKMVELFQQNVETNLTFWEMIKLARYAPDIDTDQVSHYVLDSSADSPLYSSNINGAYVLLPKRDDWSEVQRIAENIFTEGFAQSEPASPTASLSASAVIEIQNGTSVTGLAFQASQLLEGSGFTVSQIGNADTKGYEKTIIYDLTEGSKSAELEVLKEFLEAEISLTPGGWVASDQVVPRELSLTAEQGTVDGIDFLVILGENAEQLVLAGR